MVFTQANRGDRRSRFASRMLQIARDIDQAADEIRAFHAPSECMGLVKESAIRTEQRAAAELGYASAIEAWADLDSVVSARWMYFSGLHQMIEPEPDCFGV